MLKLAYQVIISLWHFVHICHYIRIEPSLPLSPFLSDSILVVLGLRSQVYSLKRTKDKRHTQVAGKEEQAV